MVQKPVATLPLCSIQLHKSCSQALAQTSSVRDRYQCSSPFSFGALNLLDLRPCPAVALFTARRGRCRLITGIGLPLLSRAAHLLGASASLQQQKQVISMDHSRAGMHPPALDLNSFLSARLLICSAPPAAAGTLIKRHAIGSADLPLPCLPLLDGRPAWTEQGLHASSCSELLSCTERLLQYGSTRSIAGVHRFGLCLDRIEQSW